MRSSRERRVAGAQLGAALILCWLGLTGGEGLLVAVPAVAAALVASHWLAPFAPWRGSLAGGFAFAGFFLVRSVVGGIDVARRALHPARPLAVVDAGYPLSLPPGRARTLFVATISLLPGTLARDLDADRVRVHSIAGDPVAELEQLEARIARLCHPEAPGR